MLNFILTIFWSVFILFIWFKTDAFEKYCKLLRIDKLVKLDKYVEYKKINPIADYLPFLRSNYKNFFVNLITCVPCFNFWLILFFSALFQTIVFFPISYIITYTIQKLLNKYVY